ncbi:MULTISPECIES: neuraminidase-like domain-containing protein [unclassified Pseudomonas]|uniref:Tc toxin subunit A-related protein n=1 Tax=unclassified Pseudomonas TaxID=196821 RepID=UPI001CC0E284|nr:MULTISPECIES: neuraminidase-like domain-containing protein [unclassified Pseudomonas]
MDSSIIGNLEERRCMALADFYLGQVAPSKEETQNLDLTSLDDLYHYLLLDSQVGQQPETSRLAEAIACMQQYIGAIYGGLEPGHTQKFTRDELVAWHQRYCNISDWAGYQMLVDYPENWISPTLRLTKSESFKELENNLGQASLGDASVQMALFEHLKGFEEICNLDMCSGYIDSIDSTGTGKGQNFKNADYYFIGRQRVQPFGYFCRKAHVELNASSTFLNPTAWTEWKAIGIPASATVLAMRAVYFAGRLMIVQVEGLQAPDRIEKDNDGKEITIPGTWQIEVTLSYLAVNGIWSTPLSLGKKEFAKASEASSRLVVVTYAGVKKDVDDLLAVCFTTTDLPPGVASAEAMGEQENGWIFAARNALFEPQVPNVASLKVLANGRFSNQNILQHKLLLSESVTITQSLVPATSVTAVGDTREGLLSKFLSLNFNFSSRQALIEGVLETVNVLQVQGVCDLDRPEFDLKEIVLVVKEEVLSKVTYFELSKAGDKGVRCTCFRSELGVDFSLCFDGLDGTPVVLETFKAADFTRANGWATVNKIVLLTPQQLETLWSMQPRDIRSGAGFSVLIGNAYTPLTNSQNALSMLKKPETVELALKVMEGAAAMPGYWESISELQGWFQTPWIEYRWTGNPVGKKLSVAWGENADGRFGRNRYDIEIKQVPNASNVPLLSKQASGAQFLDTRPLGVNGVKWIRLNSTFGPELVAKAAISIDEVLSLATQNTLEPGPESGNTVIDFNSAHGQFYWELFFHLPFLIAHRLCEERNYQESQRWYHYIFDPHIRTARPGETDTSERFWLCRPLLEKGDVGFEAKGLVDPDAIAFSNRIHYRKAIFMGYVRCIIAHADSLYRRLTRDSLVAAKLQYVRALSLMGPAPTAKAMSHWKPQSAKDILDSKPKAGASSLETFARSLDVDVANLPARVNGTPDFEILELDVFRPFTNEQLLDTWKYIEECLWNMRHNLTIDGKPMSLQLYAPPTNPVDLLHIAQAGGSSGASRNAGGWLNIPHYRFRTILSTAQNAVQTLIGFGREVLQLMEQRDRGQLEELQHSHVLALGVHAVKIQEETIKQLEASEKGLENSKLMIEERAKHYKKINESPLLAPEIAGDAFGLLGKGLGIAAMVPIAAGSVINASIKEQTLTGTIAPFPAALAGTKGGERGEPVNAVGAALSILGGVAYATGEAFQRTAFYLRRSEEWTHAANQADYEKIVVEENLKSLHHTLLGAKESLAQTKKANQHAQEIYAFYKTRATNVELYRWLLGQMATLYFQAYDAVVGLCLSVEAAFQYEMGDFDTRVIRTNAWMDDRHGLSAGQSMLLDLLRMERMFLERNERRLELTKTISLRQLFEQGKYTLAKTWKSVIDELKEGKLDFDLTQRMFDSDYPGHYCRQITTVSVSLPAVLGPYQDVRATLTQISSATVLKANIDSLGYFYEPEENQMLPLDILLNPRSHQQIGINHGVDDPGMHQLTFGDERYLPFEGTGCVSLWRLAFPRPKSVDQAKLISSLTDIIVHVRYLAKAGGTAYTEAVLDKLGD